MTDQRLREMYMLVAKELCLATGFASISDGVKIIPTFHLGDFEWPIVVVVPGSIIVDMTHPFIQTIFAKI